MTDTPPTSGHRIRIAAAGGLALTAITAIAATGAFAGKALKTKEAATTVGTGVGGATATCAKKQKAVSGGWASTVSFDPADQAVITSVGSHRDGKRSWSSTGFNLGNSETAYSTLAYCRKQKKLKTKTAEVTAPVGGMTVNPVSVTAKCKRGTKLVSGGSDTEVDVDDPDTTLIVVGDSHRVGKREWEVEGTNLGNSPGTLAAQANCAKRKAPKERTASRTFDDPFPIDNTETVEASCRKRERVVSGGFELSRSQFDEAVVLITSFQRDGKRTWVAEAGGGAEAGADPPTLTVSAYCEKTRKKRKRN